MKKLIIAVVLFLFTDLVYTQEREESQDYTHSLGVMTGSTTGLGFSYRYFPNKIGFQFTALPIFRFGEFQSSTGLSLLYKIRSHEKLDVFAYLGNHLFYDSHAILIDLPETGGYETKGGFNYNVGLGAGVNIHLWDFLDLSVKAGYGLYDITSFINTSLAGGLGLYYRF